MVLWWVVGGGEGPSSDKVVGKGDGAKFEASEDGEFGQDAGSIANGSGNAPRPNPTFVSRNGARLDITIGLRSGVGDRPTHDVQDKIDLSHS
ncbi:hypothetical protein VNO77_23190 [Canavalia gladiata]|uniref:Uncharacterized protein n=1 Tax=Canavalia gladiata TaxID=3824 RepID=A0AAN9Q8P5_CANGL